MKLSDCLISEGKSINEVVECFRCYGAVYDRFLVEGFVCADLKETGYCGAVEDCANDVCNTSSCFAQIINEEHCYLITWM